MRKVLKQSLYAQPDTGTPPDLGTCSTAPLFARPGGTPSVRTQPPAASLSPRIRWTDELRIYGDTGLFAGRRAELVLLDRTLREGKTRVLSLWAEGGAGKTRLLFQWLNGLRDSGWRGIEAIFVHSFYSLGSKDGGSASSETFFNDALAFFGYTAEPIKDFRQKGSTLAQLVAAVRGIVVLDGLEPLQYPTHDARASELKDQAVSAFLLTLANLASGLCLVSTRQELPELKARRGVSVTQQPLDRLNTNDGVALLCELEVKGPEKELQAAVECYHGHAYSLMLLGTYLRAATRDHDIRRRHDSPLIEKEAEHDHHIEHMLQMYEKHLGADSPDLAALRLLGFFDRPATCELIAVLRTPQHVVYELTEEVKKKRESRQLMHRFGMQQESANEERPQSRSVSDCLPRVTQPLLSLSEDQWQRVLTRLSELRLLSTAADGSLDSHPLLREHFAKQLRQNHEDVWRAGHRRLYEHLCGTTPDKPHPTLEDLQPLYQAIAHGCQAQLYDGALQVYRQRILRGIQGPDAFYSTGKLGAIGADLAMLACFFDLPWSRVTTALSEHRQAWLLNDTGWHLLAIGRLVEALEPLKSALEIRERTKMWKFATGVAFNLSDLELTLGDLDAAERYAKKAVELADLSHDDFQQAEYRTALGDVLHQKGQHGKAHKYFAQAEDMEATIQPEYPLLHSRQGFRYCDLLLADTERASWQQILNLEVKGQISEWGNICRKIEARASWILALDKLNRSSLFILALEHLTLVPYQQNAAHHAQDIFAHMRFNPYLLMVCEHFKSAQLSVSVLVPALPG